MCPPGTALPHCCTSRARRKPPRLCSTCPRGRLHSYHSHRTSSRCRLASTDPRGRRARPGWPPQRVRGRREAASRRCPRFVVGPSPRLFLWSSVRRARPACAALRVGWLGGAARGRVAGEVSPPPRRGHFPTRLGRGRKTVSLMRLASLTGWEPRGPTCAGGPSGDAPWEARPAPDRAPRAAAARASLCRREEQSRSAGEGEASLGGKALLLAGEKNQVKPGQKAGADTWVS